MKVPDVNDDAQREAAMDKFEPIFAELGLLSHCV